mmetsp:Transcript_43633/g.105803  ORF Transcript_43633/g.105803 Transcript_43633/m.105803 type:complete len:838 (-) Transcript_43633:170-2683(-)
MKKSISNRVQQQGAQKDGGNNNEDVDNVPHDFYVSASTDDDDEDDEGKDRRTQNPPGCLPLPTTEEEQQQHRKHQQEHEQIHHPLSSSSISPPAHPLTMGNTASATSGRRHHSSSPSLSSHNAPPLTPSRSSKTSLLHNPSTFTTISPGGTTTTTHHHNLQRTTRYTDDDVDNNTDDTDYNDQPINPIRRPETALSAPHPQRHTASSRPRRRQHQQYKRQQRRWAVFLFSLTTVLLFADQNLMSPNLTAIANDFDLDDDERDRMLGGDISLAFFLLGAPASFLVGFLADTHDRSTVFSVTVAIGEFACFGTYFVQTYHQLYICRAITGFSVGGALPVIYSILGDLFAAEDRHVVSAVVSAGLGAGISVGQAVAGYLGPSFGWRLPFLVVSIPAMICAALVYCTVQDPERGAMEQAVLDQQQQDDPQQQQHQQQSQSQYRQVDSVQDLVVCNTISNSQGGFRDDPTTTLMSSSSSSLEDGTDQNDGDDDDDDGETNYDDGQVSLVDVTRQPQGFRHRSSRSMEDGNVNNGQRFDEEEQNRQMKNLATTSRQNGGNNRNDGIMNRQFPPEDNNAVIVHHQQQEEYFDEVWTNYYCDGSGVGGIIETICPDWRQYCRTTIKLLRTPTVVLSLIQGAPGCVPWGIINVFLNDYLSEDRGFTVEMATTTLMLFSLGYSLGLIIGGAGGRVLYQIDVRYPALLAGVTAIIGCFPLWNLLNHVDSSTPYYVSAASAIVAGLGSAPTGPIIKATLTNVTLPTARGQAFAMFNLFDDFGKGLGPFFVSLLIVNFGGRLPAFNIGVFGWMICGIANLAIFFTVKRDEQKIQMELSSQFRPVPSTAVD